MRSEKEIEDLLFNLENKLISYGGENEVLRTAEKLTEREMILLHLGSISKVLEWVLGKPTEQIFWELKNR